MRNRSVHSFGRQGTSSHAGKFETLEPRQHFAATLPSQLLFQDGYSDVFVNEFTPAVMEDFTIIGGNTTNAALVNHLRSQGKLFLHNVSYVSSMTVNQLVAHWATPFNNTLGGQLSGGFDGIEIDEILPWANGSADSNKFVAALAQLRSQYPNKVIATYNALPGSNTATYSNLWNAVNTNADINLYEAYLREDNPNYSALATAATNINAFAPGLINKTIFALFSAQAGDPGDNSTNIGFFGFLEEQMHTIRNNAAGALMPGVGSYVYSQQLTTQYMGQLMDHYYVQGNTGYFGDGDTAQDIANPSFESNSNGWTLTPGAGGTVARVNYSGTGIPPTHDQYGYTSHGFTALRTVRGTSGNAASYALNVVPGNNYTVSAFVAAGGSGNPNSAKIKITSPGGSLIASKAVFEQSQINNVEPWKRILFTFKAPAGQTSVNIVLSDESVAAGTTLYWDYIEAEDSAVPPTTGGPGSNTLDVILEDFQDDNAGGWTDNTGSAPQNAGRPGTWLPSGHVANNSPNNNNMDFDWSPLVQEEIGAGLTVPTGEYIATLNRVGNQTGVGGVFNMDGIIKFSLADGSARPAVAGDKIVGSFDFFQQTGNFGFGFTDNIASLQTYQANIPDWAGGATTAPLMMPTAYSDYEGATRVGISPNITGHIAINGGSNNLFTHAVVDTFENGGLGDGYVDQGNLAPKTNANSTTNRPLNPGLATQTIRFEYTLGNSTYDLLQVDQDGPNGPGGFVNILQTSVAGTTPTPNGAMPVGKVLNSIEGMFITGASGQTTEVWYDNLHVYIEPGATPGDFNDDDLVNAADIDLLVGQIIANGQDSLFDVNDDSSVNATDLQYMVESILNTHFGDADLDGDVDLNDLSTLAANYGMSPRGWAQGNFDTDTDVDLNDLSSLAANYGLGQATAQASTSTGQSQTTATLPAATPSTNLMSTQTAKKKKLSAKAQKAADAANQLPPSLYVQTVTTTKPRTGGLVFGNGRSRR